MQISSLMSLRDTAPEELIAQYSPVTTELFAAAAQLATPHVVVIPACNEERDITATLVSLSRSPEPVVPIIVENGSSSSDRTLEYATRMGAIVAQCEPAKMRATQVGLAITKEYFPEQPLIHFGDADNLYPRKCLSTLAKAALRANQENQGNGSLMFGMGVYDHGLSKTVDLMRSGRLVRKAIERKIKGEAPMPYGFNYAIHLGDGDREMATALASLDPRLFVREESEICKAAERSGLAIGQTISPRAFVFTRSDLIRTRDEWREFKGSSMETKTKYYQRNYPGVDFTPNAKGRE